MDFKIGDSVTRISHQKDIVFEIIELTEQTAQLRGITIRLLADANIEDLEHVSPVFTREMALKEEKVQKKIVSCIKKNKRAIPGKILHIDADSFYQNKCLELYQKVGVYAIGILCKENDIPNHILKWIELYTPDIVVITGHDAYNQKGKKDLNNYLNSQYFYKAIQKIRGKYSKDAIFVIAGACQSHFEALIAAGANFAMSRNRINIHAFDPAIIAIKAAVTPFNQIIKIDDIFYFSFHKEEGIGGIESYGKMRLLL